MPLYVISHDGRGMGGFLAPPGHPDLYYVALGYYGRRKAEADVYAGLDYLASNEPGDVPEPVQKRARKIIDDAVLVCSEAYQRHAYGYFRDCYAPESGSRDVSDTVIRKPGMLPIPAEHHLGYLMVKSFFPDHEPRLDLIEDARHGYGGYPCRKCGKTVQYEARYDRLVVYPGGVECEKGGNHETEES